MKCGDLSDFKRRVEEKALASIFILSTDRFDRERALEIALGAIPGDVCRFDAEGVTPERLRSELDSGSLLSERRVVVVRSIEKGRREVIEVLQQAINSPFPGTTLILMGEKSSVAGRVGLILDLPAEKPWAVEKERPNWVCREAQLAGKKMAVEAARLLVNRVGVEKESLFRELEKLVSFVGERAEIVRSDVEQLTLVSTPPAMWELGGALFACDVGGALSIARRLIGAATPLPPLLAYLRGRIEEGIQICALLEEGGAAHVALHLPQVKRERLEEARRFGMVRLRTALLALFETEMRSRQSDGDDLLLLQRWIAMAIGL